MSDPQIQLHLQALRDYISKLQSGSNDLDEIRIHKKQLSAIQKTIRQLEKNSIPIPQSLSAEKLNLVSKINEMETASNGCLQTYESLLEILFNLGRICNKLPHKDLYQKSKAWKGQTTSPSVLRKAILKALEENGGTANQHHVYASVEKQLEGRFTPADLSRPGGKTLKWQNNVRREHNCMTKEGILTKESKGKIWTVMQ